MSHSSKCIGQSLRPQCYDNVILIKNLHTKEKSPKLQDVLKDSLLKHFGYMMVHAFHPSLWETEPDDSL